MKTTAEKIAIMQEAMNANPPYSNLELADKNGAWWRWTNAPDSPLWEWGKADYRIKKEPRKATKTTWAHLVLCDGECSIQLRSNPMPQNAFLDSQILLGVKPVEITVIEGEGM